MRPNRAHLLAALLALFVPTAASAAGTITGTLTAKSAKFRKNAVVYIEKAPWTAPAKTVEMDQKDQVFIPFVLPLVKGSSVKFLNNDATGHNVFTPDGEKFDLGVFNKDETRKVVFDKEGVYTILCKMHPSMLAYILSLQNGYFAVTGEDGSFKIENVPAGEYTLKVWHERKGADPVKVTVADGATATVEMGMK